MRKPDHSSYWMFTTKSRLDKSINSLLGIIEGITLDNVIEQKELMFLANWIAEHKDVADQHPYNELIPVVVKASEDGILTEDEKEDIKWLCDAMLSNEYYDVITANIQRLHAIIAGIASDQEISQVELNGLSNWLLNHEYLKTCWPYDEIDALITSVMRDGVIDDVEKNMLLEFFNEFVAAYTPNEEYEDGRFTLQGICAATPEIDFEGSTFCFTGESTEFSRNELKDMTVKLGGRVVSGISKKVDYVVVGAHGNPCWKYACYGRKIDEAIKLRKQGSRLLIVHENDFFDAVQDA